MPRQPKLRPKSYVPGYSDGFYDLPIADVDDHGEQSEQRVFRVKRKHVLKACDRCRVKKTKVYHSLIIQLRKADSTVRRKTTMQSLLSIQPPMSLQRETSYTSQGLLAGVSTTAQQEEPNPTNKYQIRRNARIPPLPRRQSPPKTLQTLHQQRRLSRGLPPPRNSRRTPTHTRHSRPPRADPASRGNLQQRRSGGGVG